MNEHTAYCLTALKCVCLVFLTDSLSQQKLAWFLWVLKPSLSMVSLHSMALDRWNHWSNQFGKNHRTQIAPFFWRGGAGWRQSCFDRVFAVQPNKDERQLKMASRCIKQKGGRMKHKLVVSIRPFSPATDPSLTTLGLVMYSVKFTVFSINKWTSQLANQLFLFMAEVYPETASIFPKRPNPSRRQGKPVNPFIPTASWRPIWMWRGMAHSLGK